MINTTRYWLKNCPVCQQGRLFVEVIERTGKLMLECEECSLAWDTPEQVSADKHAFLAIEIESRIASKEEIERAGWAKYVFRVSPERQSPKTTEKDA